MADYVIGGCLFICALAIFFTVANKLRNDLIDPTSKLLPEASAAMDTSPHSGESRLSLLLRVAALLVMAAIFGAEVLHQHRVDLAANAEGN